MKSATVSRVPKYATDIQYQIDPLINNSINISSDNWQILKRSGTTPRTDKRHTIDMYWKPGPIN